MLRKARVLLSALALFGVASSTMAATWNIVSVDTTVSGLHSATNPFNPQQGPSIATVTGASGTYNDMTGAVNFSLSLNNSDTLTLLGNLFFPSGGGSLSANANLAYSGLNNTVPSASSGSFGFEQGTVCCNANPLAPNSLLANGTGYLMSLWGADGFNVSTGHYSNFTTGLDVRVQLEEVSQVPVPAALWLFGSGLMGLLGLRRRPAK